MRLSAPTHSVLGSDVGDVALSYDFQERSPFIETDAEDVAIDAATEPGQAVSRRLQPRTIFALQDHVPVSHLILTHAHLDHASGPAAVRGPDTQVIAAAGFPAEAERQRLLEASGGATEPEWCQPGRST